MRFHRKMELFQVFWDDQRNLFLEFKKHEDEKQLFLPETVKRINLRYEISKVFKRESYQKSLPHLVSIKTIYFFNDFMAFSIDLSEINDPEEVQIKILNLTIFLYAGQRIEYSTKRTFTLSEICINEDCYANFSYEEINTENTIETSITQEKVYHEFEKDYKNLREKGTLVYEKNKIRRTATNNPMMSLIRENTETMKNIVDQLKEINYTLKNLSLGNVNYTAPAPTRRGPPQSGIERIKRVNGPRPNLAIQPQAPFLPELKSIMQDPEKFRSYLKPMNEEELNIIILDDEELEQKQELAIQRQIKRLEKEQPKEIIIENLKKP